jgi:hypothetical protein
VYLRFGVRQESLSIFFHLIADHGRRLQCFRWKSVATKSTDIGWIYDPRQGQIISLKKIGSGIGLILHWGHFQGMIWVANSADSREKRSTNQPDNIYLLFPSYNFFQNWFFGKAIDHIITGCAQILWRPIYNINKPVAFREMQFHVQFRVRCSIHSTCSAADTKSCSKSHSKSQRAIACYALTLAIPCRTENRIRHQIAHKIAHEIAHEIARVTGP